MAADMELYIFRNTTEVQELAQTKYGNQNFDDFVSYSTDTLFSWDNIIDVVHVSSLSHLGGEVPASVEQIEKFLDNGKVYEITDTLITQILVAMNLPDRTRYAGWNDMSKVRKRTKKMLSKNKGNLIMRRID